MTMEKRFRIDFKMTPASDYDKETGMMTVKLEPDPKRYEWKDINGEKMLYDKIDDFCIPITTLQKQLKESGGKPIYYQPPAEEDKDRFLAKRMEILIDRLEGKEPIPIFEDKSEEFLQSLKIDSLAFVIMSVDIAGSTKAITSAESERDYINILTILQSEFAATVANYNGHVLKFTGDGIIAYFPEPSFVAKNDLAADCAITIMQLVYQYANKVFAEYGLQEIDIRIGLDSGEAFIVTVGDPATKQQKDILGSVVSLACKIQSSGQRGEIRIGEITERNLHTGWREICSPVKLPLNWEYKKGASEDLYRVFKMNF